MEINFKFAALFYLHGELKKKHTHTHKLYFDMVYNKLYF